MTLRHPGRHWIAPLVLLALIVFAVAACVTLGTPTPTGAAPTGASPTAAASPTASPSPTAAVSPSPSPSPALPSGAHPLLPANPSSNPVDLLAWAFTPIFWLLFNALVVLKQLTGNIAISIILLTIVIRAVLIAPYRQQIVSQRRLQLLQPELKELQKRYKGDRNKLLAVQQQFYKERGVSPTSGCLPLVLQFMLLIPVYTVISQGLQNYDPQAMSILPLHCDAAPLLDAARQHVLNPCLQPNVWGVDWGIPEVFIGSPGGFLSGLSILAIIASLLQLVQSRMTLPPPDPTNTDQNTRIQRQMVVFLPLISLAYGSLLPAGLFLYWIGSTIFSIVQQYLIIGWGSMFPLLGWHPSFAKEHKPRFPVSIPPVIAQAGTQPISPSIDRAASAASTIRSRQRGRQGRRGRRR